MRHYCYKLVPCRPSLPFDATPAERAITGRHFTYLTELFEAGTMCFVGRCEDGEFAVSTFHAASDEEAETIMRGDPAVQAGIMTATLHPFKVFFIRGMESSPAAG